MCIICQITRIIQQPLVLDFALPKSPSYFMNISTTPITHQCRKKYLRKIPNERHQKYQQSKIQNRVIFRSTLNTKTAIPPPLINNSMDIVVNDNTPSRSGKSIFALSATCRDALVRNAILQRLFLHDKLGRLSIAC